jgi:protein FAM32A
VGPLGRFAPLSVNAPALNYISNHPKLHLHHRHSRTSHLSDQTAMPSDDYASIARGPLKLKGAKVSKSHKKKSKRHKDKTSSDVERALATTSTSQTEEDAARRVVDPQEKRKKFDGSEERDLTEERDEAEGDTKTEAERRFAEAKRKRVCLTICIPAQWCPRVLTYSQLKELTESGRVRPELLKTHKQRVEELNSHLSRLSEHHDMPKIGPG